MPAKARPKYNKPPVVEVGGCVYFNQMPSLQAAHIGAFWKMIRHNFPNTQTQPALPPLFSSNLMIGPTMGFGAPFFVDVASFPRAWFLNDANSHLVQLQGDRIIFNWRGGVDGKPYPSYEFVIKTFKTIFRSFMKFIDDTCPNDIFRIAALELFYINQIDEEHGYSGINDLSDLIKGFVYKNLDQRILGNLSNLNSTATFDLPKDDGVLNLTVLRGQNMVNGEDVARIDLVARKFVNDIYIKDAWKWFDRAHASIVSGFTELTTDKAHQLWQRYE